MFYKRIEDSVYRSTGCLEYKWSPSTKAGTRPLVEALRVGVWSSYFTNFEYYQVLHPHKIWTPNSNSECFNQMSGIRLLGRGVKRFETPCKAKHWSIEGRVQIPPQSGSSHNKQYFFEFVFLCQICESPTEAVRRSTRFQHSNNVLKQSYTHSAFLEGDLAVYFL